MVRNVISSTPTTISLPVRDRSVVPPRHRRIDCAGRCPAVCVWIISAAGVKIPLVVVVATQTIISPPGPDWGVPGSSCGRVVGGDTCPTIAGWVVSPPSLKKSVLSPPPQTIISLPVHTAVCPPRAMGALIVLVAVEVSVAGSYLPPVLK